MSVHARRGRGDSSTSTPGLDRQELGGPQGLLPDPEAPDGTFAEQFTGYSDGEHTWLCDAQGRNDSPQVFFRKPFKNVLPSCT